MGYLIIKNNSQGACLHKGKDVEKRQYESVF